ncbi:MAG: universal stress protein [Deltaproteobacteria bacterium]|nr:universal stress protein [Deltaproteobacteria bacterium]
MTMPSDSPIREILLATDFSPHSQHAARVARDLAAYFRARLHLLHVVHSAGERVAAMAELRKVAAELQVQPVVVAGEVGAPSQEIVRYAAREKVNLIVMGTHGRKGLARAVHGSVTEAVLRSAPCEVLAVRLPEETGARAPVPMSAAARAATRRCLLCAQPSDDSICSPCKARIQAEAVERKRREMQSRA